VKRLGSAIVLAVIFIAPRLWADDDLRLSGRASSTLGACRVIVSKVAEQAMLPFDRLHARLSNPLTRKTYVSVRDQTREEPTTSEFLYAETRHIKTMRDELHLSPLEVDYIIHRIKTIFDEALQLRGLRWVDAAADYKSLNGRFSTLDRVLLHEALAETKRQTEQELRMILGTHRAQQVAELFSDLRLLNLGIGANLNRAAIGARVDYVRENGDGVYSYEDNRLMIQGERYALAGALSKLIAELESTEKSSLWISETEFGKSLSPLVNDILRKESDAQAVGEKLKEALELEEAPSPELTKRLMDAYRATRLFEPKLEYREFEHLRDHQEVPSVTLKMENVDFIASVDIRQVGAHHASVIQGQVLSSTAADEGIDAFVDSLNYGSSVRRLWNLMDQADQALGQSFKMEGESELAPAKLAGKVSGDESIHFYRGTYSAEMLQDLLKRTSPDHRLVVVNLESFRNRGERVDEARYQEIRHLGEQVAKNFVSQMARRKGHTAASQVRFLIEAVAAPSGGKPFFQFHFLTR
jgi:hypothetical protein